MRDSDPVVVLCAAIREASGAPGVTATSTVDTVLKVLGGQTTYAVPKAGEFKTALADLIVRGLVEPRDGGVGLTETGEAMAQRASIELMRDLNSAHVIYFYTAR